MRTTITLADDVAAAVEQTRRERSLGLSDAVNELIRAGLTPARPKKPFRQTTHDLGIGVDVSNIAETLERLEGPFWR